MKIVIDGFGGDNSPDEVLKGAALAVNELGIDIAITGDEKLLMQRMKELNISDSHIELVPAEGVITTEDAPKSVIKENSGTSMGKALYYLADGNADAFIRKHSRDSCRRNHGRQEDKGRQEDRTGTPHALSWRRKIRCC